MQQLQKTYSLPNCTLVLDGMSDPSGVAGGGAMTLLTNAVCRFLDHDVDLSGGSDFFNSLVPAVSEYAQAQLSGLNTAKTEQGLVKIEPMKSGRHQISVAPEADVVSIGGATAAQKFELTTVQLFDLVEAIDQFLGDRSTLPNQQLSLEPVSKRHAPSQLPIAQRLAAPTLGAVGLATAAAALFALDVPKIQRPIEEPRAKVAQTSEKPLNKEGDPAGVKAVDPDSVQDPAINPPAITDTAELTRIKETVSETVNSTWNEYSLPTFAQDATYRVSVSEAGDIVGYRGLDELSRNVVDQLPLEKLLYIPPTDAAVSDEPLAEFKMTFTPEGVLEVEPWSGDGAEAGTTAPGATATEPGSSASGRGPETSRPETSQPETSQPETNKPEASEPEASEPEATESETTGLNEAELDELSTSALNADLYNSINSAWKDGLKSSEDLEFRVKVNIDSDIVSYEPLNEAAKTSESEVPLGTLKKSGAAGESSDFKVVFKADGKLEVSPWEGSTAP